MVTITDILKIYFLEDLFISTNQVIIAEFGQKPALIRKSDRHCQKEPEELRRKQAKSYNQM